MRLLGLLVVLAALAWLGMHGDTAVQNSASRTGAPTTAAGARSIADQAQRALQQAQLRHQAALQTSLDKVGAQP